MPSKKKTPVRALVVSEPLESVLDNPVDMPNLSRVLQAVDSVFAEAQETDNPELVFALTDKLVQASGIVGPALARILWLQSHNWDTLGKGIEVPFEEFAQHRWGKELDTIRRYIGVEDFHDAVSRNKQIKGDTSEDLKSLPMQAQIRMAQHYRQHGAFSAKDLKDLAQSTSTREVVDKLKALRGETESNKPNSGVRFVVNTTNNELVAWVGDEMEVMAILRKSTNTEAAMRARETMLRRLGAEEK